MTHRPRHLDLTLDCFTIRPLAPMSGCPTHCIARTRTGIYHDIAHIVSHANHTD
jgi:hypothetical protein